MQIHPGAAEQDFQRLADQGFTKIPLIARRYCDLDTPLGLYLKLVGLPGSPEAARSFLLESVVAAERFGRYSFIGLPARTVLATRGRGVDAITEVHTDGELVEQHRGNALEFIEADQQRFRVATPPDAPRFCGGLCGYFGYDVVRHIEARLAKVEKSGGLDTPDIMLLVCDEVAVIDNLAGTLTLLVYADVTQRNGRTRALQRLNELTAKLDRGSQPVPVPQSIQQATVRSFDKSDYLQAVKRAKEYIAAGDMMQVQIGQRLSKLYSASPLALYRALRFLNPSPYMYYYDMGEFHIVGASPEILVRQERCPQGQKITIRPLAGTRPRGATPEQDKALEEELLHDPKERAEHVMLIDLARNDIGRIAQTGSVKVTEAFTVERYSHVMHIISNVEGILLPGISNMDVLRATFPAGTLTGAPKIRAMEIIDELEPVKRGIYGGAVGYLSYNGDMDVAIAIRTAIVKDGQLYAQASAGIVADSIPEMEWLETEAKARAILHASEMVEQGF
jgi:anthranilate synthase component 1